MADLYSDVPADAATIRAALFVAPTFPTVAALLASSLSTLGAQDSTVVAGGLRYLIAATGASDHHVTTAGGVKLYVQPDVTGRLNLAAFGADTTGVVSCVAAAQKAADAGTTARIRIPRGTYKWDGAVFIGAAQSIDWECDPGVLIEGYGRITNVTTADTTYPTTTVPGPLTGCAFYLTTVQYYSKFKGFVFNNFRWPLAFLVPHNTPSFIDINYKNCNSLSICYQGSQNHNYVGCYGEQNGGPLLIAGATCFPSGSPYAGLDNYYCDGLRIDLAGASSGSARSLNANFDAWFYASIFRGTTNSVPTGTSGTYPLADTDPICQPSGWALAYVPMRNLRSIFGASLKSIDARFSGAHGIGCFNSDVRQFDLDFYQYEWNTSPLTKYHWALGRAYASKASRVDVSASGHPKIPFIRWTNRGGTGAQNAVAYYAVAAFPNQLADGTLAQAPIKINETAMSTRDIAAGAPDWLETAAADGTNGIIFTGKPNGFRYGGFGGNGRPESGEADGPMMSSHVGSFLLPYEHSDGFFYNKVTIRDWNSIANRFHVIHAVNLADGARDQATYQGNPPFSSVTLTGDLAEGDATVRLSNSLIEPLTCVVVGGVTLVIKAKDPATGYYVLMNPARGLAGTQTSGTAVTLLAGSATISAFASGWFGVSVSNAAIALNRAGDASIRNATLTGSRYLISITRRWYR